MAKDNSLKVITHILGWFTGFIGPLIMFLVSTDKDVKKHAKMALNWQISVIIYVIVSILLMVIIIGFFTIAAVAVMNIIFCIMAAVKASDGKLWKYPMSIPFLKV